MAATLLNARSLELIATGLELALTRSARRQGLLARDGLDPLGGLLLAPCLAVHTAFMRFAIDVIFVDRTGCVTRVVRRLQPWRIAASRHAYATIELEAGALDSREVMVGDRLYLVPMPLADADDARAISSLFAHTGPSDLVHGLS